MIQGDMGTMGTPRLWARHGWRDTRVRVAVGGGRGGAHVCACPRASPCVSRCPLFCPRVSRCDHPRVPSCPHVSPDPCGCPQASGDRLLSEKVQQGGSPKLGPGVHGCHHPGDMGAVALGTWVPPSWDHGCHHPRAIGPPPPHPEDVGTTTLGTWVATTLRTWVATTLGTWVPPLWGHGCHHFGDTGPHLGFPLQIAPQLRSQQLI